LDARLDSDRRLHNKSEIKAVCLWHKEQVCGIKLSLYKFGSFSGFRGGLDIKQPGKD
jgi:hypothetical protein